MHPHLLVNMSIFDICKAVQCDGSSRYCALVLALCGNTADGALPLQSSHARRRFPLSLPAHNLQQRAVFAGSCFWREFKAPQSGTWAQPESYRDLTLVGVGDVQSV
jgi:hypothetical protein